MRGALSVLAVLSSIAPSATAHACDPIDATAFVGASDDGFVFVTRQTVLRLSASGQVEHRRTMSDDSGSVALLSDGRTLLQLVPTGPAADCRASRMRFELVDSASNARPRVIGTLPARSDGVDVRDVRMSADGTLTVRLETYVAADDSLVHDDVAVRPDTRRVRAVRVATPEGEAPAPLEPAPQGALRIALSGNEDALQVRDPSGAVRVTVALASRVADWALSADGHHLAIVTYSVVNEDYGTGWDARVEIVDLTRGVRVASHGDGTDITAIRGSVRVTCESRVHDPGSELNVRAAPSTRAAVVATLAHDRAVSIAESRGRWRRLSAPAEGWVWADNLTQTCTAAPP